MAMAMAMTGDNDNDNDNDNGGHDDWQDEWQIIGEAELEVLRCLEEGREVLCRAWKLEREISARKVARWLDVPLALCHHWGRAKMARMFFDIIGGTK